MLRGILGAPPARGAPIRGARTLPLCISGSTSWQWARSEPGARTHADGVRQAGAGENRTGSGVEPGGERGVVV